LAKITAEADRADDLGVYLSSLGVTHRRFGAVAEHYDAVGASLLATLAYFSGEAWTPELAADWGEAFALISSTMITAARQDEEQGSPPFWHATVISCERRAFDISVITLRADPAMTWLPGQSVTVETPQQPRLWRWYSPANAPREDGTLEFHVRLVDGGAVSMALQEIAPGTVVRLGPPAGVLTLAAAPGRDVLMAGASTGLAPLKALAEHAAQLARPPRVTLLAGARTAQGLYDLRSLDKMTADHPWLTVIPCVTSEGASIADVIARRDWSGHDAYLAGPSEMVQAAAAVLATAGMPPACLHIEDFGWSDR
jgi:NAD(P)H-flavin reductase